MVKQNFLFALLLVVIVAIAHCASSPKKSTQSPAKALESDTLIEDNGTKRTGRIMKVLKDPNGNPPAMQKHIRAPQKPQSRRDHYPPPGSQRPLPLMYHRNPAQLPYASPHNQVLRRVQNGPPPNTLLRPQQHKSPPQQLPHYDQGKGSRYLLNAKENGVPLNGGGSGIVGKTAVFRSQFVKGPHPNSLPLPQGSPRQHSQLNHFKASPQYSGSPIVRPASEYPQYAKLLHQYMEQQDIKQHPLPQQHPQLQLQQQQPLLQSSTNTAPQTFPSIYRQPENSQTEPLQLLKSNHGDSAQKMYSVYEDPEIGDRASIQYTSQLNSPAYNPSAPQPTGLETSSPIGPKEAEEYLKFMSTNEYFLPKFHPDYKRLDEEKDLQQFKQQHRHQPQQNQQQYGRVFPPVDTSQAATFQHPIEVSQLFYQPDPSSDSTIVRGSYQAGNNVFIVKSDGNNAVKHVVPNSAAQLDTTTPSVAGSYSKFHLNSVRHRTPEPIRFEFTERDAVQAAYTSAPPSNGHLRYKAVDGTVASNPNAYGIQAATIPSAASVSHSHPISVNEVDTDPEDGDDMHETGTGFYGRVPIRKSAENISGSSTTTTPATEQKDTEEYCERICANVQDDDEEIVCGSDGYMYTGEAQMECYASCLHIDVTIQGKGSCSAR